MCEERRVQREPQRSYCEISPRRFPWSGPNICPSGGPVCMVATNSAAQAFHPSYQRTRKARICEPSQDPLRLRAALPEEYAGLHRLKIINVSASKKFMLLVYPSRWMGTLVLSTLARAQIRANKIEVIQRQVACTFGLRVEELNQGSGREP